MQDEAGEIIRMHRREDGVNCVCAYIIFADNTGKKIFFLPARYIYRCKNFEQASLPPCAFRSAYVVVRMMTRGVLPPSEQI